MCNWLGESFDAGSSVLNKVFSRNVNCFFESKLLLAWMNVNLYIVQLVSITFFRHARSCMTPTLTTTSSTLRLSNSWASAASVTSRRPKMPRPSITWTAAPSTTRPASAGGCWVKWRPLWPISSCLKGSTVIASDPWPSMRSCTPCDGYRACHPQSTKHGSRWELSLICVKW